MNDYKDIEPVFVGFSQSIGKLPMVLLGKAIRVFTGGDVNHAWVVYWDKNWSAWLIVGANSNGLTFDSLPNFLKSHKVIYLFSAENFRLWEGLSAHVNDLNTGYDYRGLINMSWVEVGKKITGHPWGNLLANDHRLFCSEWCSEFIKTAIAISHLEKEWPLWNNGYHDNQVDPTFLCNEIITAPKLWTLIDKEVITKPWINLSK
jgi:hypothetical protein